jgi:hypothetical protein
LGRRCEGRTCRPACASGVGRHWRPTEPAFHMPWRIPFPFRERGRGEGARRTVFSKWLWPFIGL